METIVKQRQLYYLNYRGNNNSMLVLDGVWGSNSATACKSFQKQYGLVVDGIYGYATESKMKEVWKGYQKQLNSKGYSLVVDGICGNATINAIKDFQKKNNLVADGIIGQATIKALNGSAPAQNVYMTAEDWKKSKYFKESEFRCPCGCGKGQVKKGLVDNLNKMREHFGKPITITSGLRCPDDNRKEGGVSNSKHLTTIGGASDIYISGISDTHNGRKQIVDYWIKTFSNANYSYCNGYGKTKSSTSYPSSNTMGNAVHVDVI